jgi:hypothetical protein
MDGEGGLAFPNIGNNTMQSSETGAFTRDSPRHKNSKLQILVEYPQGI